MNTILRVTLRGTGSHAAQWQVLIRQPRVYKQGVKVTCDRGAEVTKSNFSGHKREARPNGEAGTIARSRFKVDNDENDDNDNEDNKMTMTIM